MDGIVKLVEGNGLPPLQSAEIVHASIHERIDPGSMLGRLTVIGSLFVLPMTHV